MSEVFCDYLSLTVPLEYGESVLSNVDSFLLGFYSERTKPNEYRSSSGGSFYWGSRNGVYWFNSSGRWLEDLRVAALLPSFLQCFCLHESDFIIPHKVTKLDLAYDLPLFPPDEIARVSSLGFSGEVSLTRKAISSKHYKELIGACLYSPGHRTGTVYFGRRGYHNVVLRVYDKRQERLSAGRPDIPNTVRYEQTNSIPGISLRDVVTPHDLFWSYMCPKILPKPSYTVWTPLDSSYALNRTKPLPALKLKHCVEESMELERLIKRSLLVGEKGIDYLCSLIRRKASAMAKAST
jgi:hypothetical protein